MVRLTILRFFRNLRSQFTVWGVLAFAVLLTMLTYGWIVLWLIELS